MNLKARPDQQNMMRRQWSLPTKWVWHHMSPHLSCYEGNLRGYCTPKLKLACFVSYLKIIDTFFEN